MRTSVKLATLFGRASTPVPLTISGLVGWWDASDAATLFTDDAGTTAATANNDVIGRWADKSGNGRHAQQSTTDNKPLLKTNVQNGKNVIRFDGTDDNLDGSLTSAITGNEATLFVVGTVTAFSKSAYFDSSDNGTTNRSLLLFFDASSVYWRAGGSASATFAFSTAGYRIWETPHTTGARSITVNGTEQATNSTSATIATPTTFRFGALYNTLYRLAGDMAEVVLFNRVLTSDERTSVRGYLNSKWAVY